MRVPFVTCDVFTDRPFAGNPLLVVPDGRGLTKDQMQAIAREINYSESTFVLPPDDPAHAYRQRTFVPTMEIPYAGHPTIGTAVVLAALGRIGKENGAEVSRVVIEVGFGPLGLELFRRDGVISRVRMEQGRPSWDEPVSAVDVLGRLAAALNLSLDDLHPELRPRAVSTGNKFLMLPLRSLDAVSRAVADGRVLSLASRELDALGVYFFAFDGARVRARMFAPDAGVPEDPATGSAAGPLGVYLALEGALPASPREGVASFLIDQGVEMGRPSELAVEVLFDGASPAGVRVAGSAVLMMEGSIAL